MMKTLIILTTSFAAFGIQQAQAVVTPGWDRPVYQARMDIVKATGKFADARHASLTMTKQDGRKAPTGLVLLIDDQVMHLEIKQTKVNRCGITEYLALPISDVPSIIEKQYKLVLRENAKDGCNGKSPHQWEGHLIRMNEFISSDKNDQESLEMVGSPETVLTIQ